MIVLFANFAITASANEPQEREPLSLEERLIGTWRWTDQHNWILVFREDGTMIDGSPGLRSTHNWMVLNGRLLVDGADWNVRFTGNMITLDRPIGTFSYVWYSSSTDAESGFWILAVIGGIILLVIAGVIVLIVVLVKKSGNKQNLNYGNYNGQPYGSQHYNGQNYNGQGYNQQTHYQQPQNQQNYYTQSPPNMQGYNQPAQNQQNYNQQTYYQQPQSQQSAMPTNPIPTNYNSTPLKHVVGKPSIVANIIVLAVNIILDIWFLLSGAFIWFMICFVFTILPLLSLIRTLRSGIVVDDAGVSGKVKKEEFRYTYNQISSVSMAEGTDGKTLLLVCGYITHSISIKNAEEVREAIAHNMAALGVAPAPIPSNVQNTN